MDKILQQLGDPVFWFSVVVVGLVINVVSGFVKDRLDGHLGQYSLRRQLLTAARRKQREQRIRMLANNFELIQASNQWELRKRIRSVIILAMGTALSGALRLGSSQLYLDQTGEVASLAILATSVLVSYSVIRDAATLRSEVREAYKLRHPEFMALYSPPS